jgi:ribonuclease HIII
MTQETRVFGIGSDAAGALRRSLEQSLSDSAEWRVPPHSRFWVKADGVVLTVYESGKGVLQGEGARLDDFVAKHLAFLEAGVPRTARPELETLAMPTLGSDESGKGDYFGPLVVAAVFALPEDAAYLRELGVADSKTLSDPRMHAQAGKIEERLDHEVRVLMPAHYNARIEATSNANAVLADLHADALAALASRHADAQRTVVDRFSSTPVLEKAFASRGCTIPSLDLRPGAESHPVVAAASILARVHFLDGLRACADECATDLPKGAGAAVDSAAATVVEIGGRALLAKVAKLHFRNTLRVRGADR